MTDIIKENLTEKELIEKNIASVLSDAFLEYSGYNIQRRGVPDARDLLKWGARQLLHAQWLNKLTHDKPFKKATKTVGAATSYSYVHGDSSAYGTIIRMAKPFAYRYLLQDCNGNYGTQMNPKDHAASRYVELRGSEFTNLLLQDLDKDTVNEWEDTYDLEGKFPKVLPSKGFYNLVNGAMAISSGMTVSIPQFNIKELNESLKRLLLNPEINEDELIIMPDFCTGAILLNEDEVRQSLKKGYGFSCKLRSVIEFDSKERCFIVKELPYSVYTNTICSELANLIANDEKCPIKDFADYTKRAVDLRIYFDKKANADTVLKYLYKNTSLQYFFPINMNLLDKGKKPKTFGWKELLQARIDYEKEVYLRGYQYDIRKIEARLHIIKGLLIVIEDIDNVIKLIKTSKSTAEAKNKLKEQYSLDDAQARAVLDIKLSRLAHLEVEKLKTEQSNLMANKQSIEDIINNKDLFDNEIIKGWDNVTKKFGDARRTKIMNIEKEDEEEPKEIKTLSISLTNKNNLYATEVSTLYVQRRNSVGTKFKLDKDEYIISNITANNNDTILFFTKGTSCNCYHLAGINIPIEIKTPLEALLNLNSNEKVFELVNFNKKDLKENIIFITKKGMLKKSKFSEYNTKRAGGIKALELNRGDELLDVIFTDNENIGLVTEEGRLLICPTQDIRPIGRVAKGVKGIKLDEGDGVSSVHIIPKDTKEIVSISNKGYFKKTPFCDFGVTGRYTKGQKIQKLKEEDEYIADFLPLKEEKNLIVISSGAQLKISTDSIPLLGKNTLGVKSIKLKDKDMVVSLSKE